MSPITIMDDEIELRQPSPAKEEPAEPATPAEDSAAASHEEQDTDMQVEIAEVIVKKKKRATVKKAKRVTVTSPIKKAPAPRGRFTAPATNMQVSVQLRKGKKVESESSESRIVFEDRRDDHCHRRHSDISYANNYLWPKNAKDKAELDTPNTRHSVTKAFTSEKKQELGTPARRLNQSVRVDTAAADTTKDYSRGSISAFSNPYKNIMSNTADFIEEEQDETSPVTVEKTNKSIIRTKKSVPNPQLKKKARKNVDQVKAVDRTLTASDVLSRSFIVTEAGLSEARLTTLKKEKRVSFVNKQVARTKSANYLGLTNSFRGKTLTASETARAVPSNTELIKAMSTKHLNDAQERARKRVAQDKEVHADKAAVAKHKKNQPSVDSRGSTGARPSGVLLRHGNVDCFVEDRETQLASAEDLSQKQPWSRYESAVHAFKTQQATQHRRYYSELSSQ